MVVGVVQHHSRTVRFDTGLADAVRRRGETQSELDERSGRRTDDGEHKSAFGSGRPNHDLHREVGAQSRDDFGNRCVDVRLRPEAERRKAVVPDDERDVLRRVERDLDGVDEVIL
jgi:hypothetical protein